VFFNNPLYIIIAQALIVKQQIHTSLTQFCIAFMKILRYNNDNAVIFSTHLVKKGGSFRERHQCGLFSLRGPDGQLHHQRPGAVQHPAGGEPKRPGPGG
jgi:hypothetical protein